MILRFVNLERSRKLRALISKIGLSIRFSSNARPLDLRWKNGVHPVTAVYEGGGRDVILRVPMIKCVFENLNFFPVCKSSESPKIKTLNSYMVGNCDCYEGSPLEAFYNKFQPKNAAEMLRIENPHYMDFKKMPPLSAILPWQNISPDIRVALTNEVVRSEFVQQKAKGFLLNQWQHAGPVSKEFGCIEFERLINVLNSIKSKSYLIDTEGFNNINALCLIKSDGDVRYFIVAGQHRVAALAALGYQEIDLQIKGDKSAKIIDESHIKYWPGVVGGYFNFDEAKSIFYRCFK